MLRVFSPASTSLTAFGFVASSECNTLGNRSINLEDILRKEGSRDGASVKVRTAA